MGFVVSGWVEFNWLPIEERDGQGWQALLSLGPFGLCGEEVSRYLFGLAKDSNEWAPFFQRGAPDDASEVVRNAVTENERYLTTRRDGEFGHTYAWWGEIQEALAKPGAPSLERDEVGGWPAVFDAIRLIALRLNVEVPANQLRLVVWASW